MTNVLALPANHTATLLASPLPSNLSRQFRFIGLRRRQVLRTDVAVPIAICAEKNKEVNPLLKFAVSAVTEILRIFNRKDSSEFVSDCTTPSYVSVANVDDLIAVLESDYKRSYFLTGELTASIYAEDCCFVDPTIKFNGRDLYQRNLQLLVPFFENPSLLLSSIEQGLKGDKRFIEAKWQLRTYLKFPWRPLISLEGSTVYDLNDDLKIINHAESWSISAFEAIIQIFVPSSYLFSDK